MMKIPELVQEYSRNLYRRLESQIKANNISHCGFKIHYLSFFFILYRHNHTP